MAIPWGTGSDERHRLLSAKLTHYHAAKRVKPDVISFQSLSASVHLSIGPKSTIMMMMTTTMMATASATTTTMVMVVLMMLMMMMMMMMITTMIMIIIIMIT